jgi:hypothetical protein
MTPVERFGVLLTELNQTLETMPPDQGLHAVFANDEILIRFYLRIASLNRFFTNAARTARCRSKARVTPDARLARTA